MSVDATTNADNVVHALYVIRNPVGKTYNGYTIDTVRRLRQHDGDIKGGAKFTTAHRGPWSYVLILSSPVLDYRRALSMEWSIRYPTNHRPRPTRYSSPSGRIEGMALVLANPKFADVRPLTIRVFSEDHASLLLRLLKTLPVIEPEGITISFQKT
jgi:structure-specific endonuclease subunit SLX1